MTLQMWNNMTTKTIGKTRLIVRNSENNKKYNVEFQVVKEDRTPLIGRKAAEDMKLITVNYDNFKQLSCKRRTFSVSLVTSSVSMITHWVLCRVQFISQAT